MTKKQKSTWAKLTEMPGNTLLDGRRIRYKKHTLGYLKSAWNRGLWLTQKPQEWGSVQPWFPPDGKELKDIADDLEVEA